MVQIFEIVRAVWPFYAILAAVLLVAYVPPVTLLLPGLLYGP